MIILRSDELLVRIDPAHGGEILDLIDLSTGRQLLGRPPFGSELPLPGDLDETTWTASYRGGWQTVLPNAGNACEVGGDRHGFHGSASIDPWEASETTERATLLRWSGHGLQVEKRITLEDGAVAIRYRIENATDGPVPLVSLEHLSVGLEILHPTVRLAFPAAKAYELSESEGPLEPPAHATGWPQIALLDGGTERGDEHALETPRSRLYVMNGLAEGWAAVWSATRGQGLALAWDVSLVPARVGLAREPRLRPIPGASRARSWPSSRARSPTRSGLAVAEEAGQARVLAPGEVAEPWIVARPFVADRRRAWRGSRRRCDELSGPTCGSFEPSLPVALRPFACRVRTGGTCQGFDLASDSTGQNQSPGPADLRVWRRGLGSSGRFDLALEFHGPKPLLTRGFQGSGFSTYFVGADPRQVGRWVEYVRNCNPHRLAASPVWADLFQPRRREWLAGASPRPAAFSGASPWWWTSFVRGAGGPPGPPGPPWP